eukprot:706626-Pleurochrysis_carterae.AAC.3
MQRSTAMQDDAFRNMTLSSASKSASLRCGRCNLGCTPPLRLLDEAISSLGMNGAPMEST